MDQGGAMAHVGQHMAPPVPASAHVKAKILTLENAASQCIGTALVRNDCWSFLKGGFALNSSSQTSVLYFQVSCDVEFCLSPGHRHMFMEEREREREREREINSAFFSHAYVFPFSAADCKPKRLHDLDQKRLLAAVLT